MSDGWFQTTPSGTGSTARAGLHSVIEGCTNQLFMTVYEPRTLEAMTACTSTKPVYNLAVSAKMIQIQRTHIKNHQINNNFQIIIAFKSISDYAIITCDLASENWVLLHCKDGNNIVISEASDSNLKPNIFYDLFIQVRDNTLSVDINGSPVFTAIRFTDGMSMNGLLGLQAMVILSFVFFLILFVLIIFSQQNLQ